MSCLSAILALLSFCFCFVCISILWYYCALLFLVRPIFSPPPVHGLILHGVWTLLTLLSAMLLDSLPWLCNKTFYCLFSLQSSPIIQSMSASAPKYPEVKATEWLLVSLNITIEGSQTAMSTADKAGRTDITHADGGQKQTKAKAGKRREKAG